MERQMETLMHRKKVVAWVLLIPTMLIGGVVAIVVYVVSVILTNLLAINLSLSIIAFLTVCYFLIKFIARHLGLVRPHRFAFQASIVATLILVVLVTLPTFKMQYQAYPENISETFLDKLRDKTFLLNSVSAGGDFDDLHPLRIILKDTRIVALGEASHGTSEFFQMKHRLLEFLVNEMGFQHFGMELSPAKGQALNAYITGQVDELPPVLYWPWATTEVVAMLEWMRAYNADPTSPHQLTFHGIDPTTGDRDAQMAENVTRILTQSGPESKIVLWAHNSHISKATGKVGYHLKQHWSERAYLLGFEFNYGAFTSRFGSVHVYKTDAASPAYYAYVLRKLNEPILLLDFKTMVQDANLQDWLAQPQHSHEFQELHAIFRLNPNWYTLSTSWLQLYDGVIYIEESTPALGLP